jgi:hypothetical protein
VALLKTASPGRSGTYSRLAEGLFVPGLVIVLDVVDQVHAQHAGNVRDGIIKGNGICCLNLPLGSHDYTTNDFRKA